VSVPEGLVFPAGVLDSEGVRDRQALGVGDETIVDFDDFIEVDLVRYTLRTLGLLVHSVDGAIKRENEVGQVIWIRLSVTDGWNRSRIRECGD
jgi:hypothetical protein